MCGICGLTAPVDDGDLRRIPDDEGAWVSPGGRIGLGSRRLSTIDLTSAAHMPMLSEGGRVALVHDGEIYNRRELRRELERHGHRFRSHTDTEVLLRGYQQWGAGMVPKLNGIFTFAVWDEDRQRLLLARDRFGVKPLYYHLGDSGRLMFASEVKALLAAGCPVGDPDPAALHRFLTFLWVPGPATMFPRVLKLMPGRRLIWEDCRVSIERYWRPSFAPRPTTSVVAATELRRRLEDAVSRQLTADVPVGVFLSGGLDSTALTALATRARRAPLKAYTIRFRGRDASLEQSSDDARYARVAARHCGADLREIEVAPQIAELLPEVVDWQEEPVADPAAIATYMICRAARGDVTVLLSGQGADEIFAGYRVHGMPFVAEALRLVPAALRTKLAAPLLAALPKWATHVPGVNPGFVLAVHRYLTTMLKAVDLPFTERYVAYRSYYTDEELRGLYAPDVRAALRDETAGSEHLAYFADVSTAAKLNRLLYVDWHTFLPELNLAYGDKMSMAASVQLRVPFLDHEIVDFMLTVPPSLKLRGPRSKYVLRRAVADIVPSAILRRRKAGFGAPIRAWLRRDLHEMVDDLLGEQSVAGRGLLEPSAVRRLIDDHRSGRADNTYRIWALLTLELWMQTFVDDGGRRAAACRP